MPQDGWGRGEAGGRLPLRGLPHARGRPRADGRDHPRGKIWAAPLLWQLLHTGVSAFYFHLILFEIFSTKDSPQQSEVGEAVKRLREAIQEGGNRGPHAQVKNFKPSIFQHINHILHLIRASTKKALTSLAAGFRTTNQWWTHRWLSSVIKVLQYLFCDSPFISLSSCRI